MTGTDVRSARVVRPIDDPAFEQLFRTEVAPMTWLAALLGDDDPESVVQKAFVRLHHHWYRSLVTRRPGRAPSLLHRSPRALRKVKW